MIPKRLLAAALSLCFAMALTLSAQDNPNPVPSAAPGGTADAPPPASQPATVAVSDAPAPAAAAKKGLFAWFGAPVALRMELNSLYLLNLDPSATDTSSTFKTTDLLTKGLGLVLEYNLGQAGSFTFEPGFLIYDALYSFTAAGRAVPGVVEFRDAYVLGLFVDLPFLFHVKLGGPSSLAFGLGLAPTGNM